MTGVRKLAAALLGGALVAGTGGCQRNQPGPKPPVVQDMETLCNVEALSGARAPGQTTAPSFVIATYLADHLETPQVIGLLGDLAQTPAGKKEAFLREQAHRAGLSSCPLAETWAAHAAEKAAAP